MRQLSENARKTILWSVLIILGITLFFLWGKNVIETFRSTSFPKVPQELKESIQRTQEEFILPAFKEIEIPDEILKELQEYGQDQGQ